MRVLIVEDDPRIANLLLQGLEEEGYQATATADGRIGLTMAESGEFEVIVLDLMLPGIDGLTIARKLRKAGDRTPILMLTARDSNQDIVHGLDIGADDYITKPFSLDVFLARVRAVSRRGPVITPVVLRIADLELDSGAHHASRSGRQLQLTPREFRLLELLLRSSPRVVPRQTILDDIWGYDSEISPNNLEAFVSQLRSKVDTRSSVKLIQTIRGVGYCLREEPA